MSTFTGKVSKTLGILPIDITIGNKTSLFSFFVIDSLDQFLLFWKGNEVEVVRADKQAFMVARGFVEERYYDQEFNPIKFTGRRKDGVKHTWTQRTLWKSKRRRANS